MAQPANRRLVTEAAFVPRMESIEAMVGLAPGEVTDAQTANLITRLSTQTRTALDALYITPEELEAALGQAGSGIDLTGYATEQYVIGRIAEIPPPVSLTGYATEQYVNERIAEIPPPTGGGGVDEAALLAAYEAKMGA